MSDICHCTGENCPLKKDCHRYTVEAYGRRSFFGQPPFNPLTQTCAHFWANQAAIRSRAYLLWEQAGKPQAKEVFFWLQAETELTQQ